MLQGVRVLDRSTDIAGPYCTKLLADAGADVVKVEPAGGDPLRRWRSGALFEFLNVSKRSVLNGDDLEAGADVIVLDRGTDRAAVRARRERRPDAVVVVITPFGLDGPWADHPATEFTLQAMCGSTGHRGVPEQPPIAAGGRVGEWMAGTYAAVGALAAWREARRSGHGDLVDVAMLDCMAITMTTFPSLFASFLGWPPITGTGRSIEVPSIEPTSDGYVDFTTNSAQQFADFLTLIGRPDLRDDAELARPAPRFLRRAEFLAMVHRYTTARTTAEVLEEAALLRIPSGPVLNGATVQEFEHFVAVGAFVESPSGRFRQPRTPYAISDAPGRAFTAAPALAEHEGAVDWRARPPRGSDGPRSAWQLPLAGTRILDCTAWWAGPSASQTLGALGADVVKVESITRPDLMRFAGTRPPTVDQWWEWGGIAQAVNTNKRGITLDLTRADGVALFERLARDADAVVENYTPRVMGQFGLGWERLHQVNPRLVMVRMPAFGLSGPWRDRTGFAQTMECVTGMAWVTGKADGPPVLVRGTCDPLAGQHAAFATILALDERDRTGEGRLVETRMAEAALNAAAEQVVEYGASGTVLSREGNRGPVAAPQGLYACAGDDTWLALAVTTDDEWTALVDLVGEPGLKDPALATTAGRREHADRIDAVVSSWTGRAEPHALAATLVAAGVPASAVIAGRDILANPQIAHRRLFETVPHPVNGEHALPGLPMRLSRVDRWIRRPAPTLGQHNTEVLTAAGLTAAEVDALAASGLIGERVV